MNFAFAVIDPERFIGPPSFEECMAGVERRIAEEKKGTPLIDFDAWNFRSRSIASSLVSYIALQRNPQGSERFWQNVTPIVYHPENAQRLANVRLLPEDRLYIEQTNPGIFAVCAAEIGFALAAAIAAVETVAYTILTAASLLALPFSSDPLRFWANLLKSSSFTILWAASYMVFYNIFVRNVVSLEPFAYERLHMADLLPCFFDPPTVGGTREEMRLPDSADMVWQQRYIWESRN